MKTILFLLMLYLTFVSAAYAEFTRDDEKNIVTDECTGLMWQDNDITSAMTWFDAVDYCENSAMGDYSDWRLPNRSELLSIIDKSRNKPAMSPTFNNVVLNSYWSSTPLVNSSGFAWIVHFSYGGTFANYKHNAFFVRCVRGGQ